MIYGPIELRSALLGPAVFLSRFSSIKIRTTSNPAGSPASALRAESSKNKLAFTNNSLPERSRARLGHVVPVDILNIAASVTHEMVMAHAFQIESAGAALDRHFPHQPCLHQISQVVVGCRP